MRNYPLLYFAFEEAHLAMGGKILGHNGYKSSSKGQDLYYVNINHDISKVWKGRTSCIESGQKSNQQNDHEDKGLSKDFILISTSLIRCTMDSKARHTKLYNIQDHIYISHMVYLL